MKYRTISRAYFSPDLYDRVNVKNSNRPLFISYEYWMATCIRSFYFLAIQTAPSARKMLVKQTKMIWEQNWNRTVTNLLVSEQIKGDDGVSHHSTIVF